IAATVSSCEFADELTARIKSPKQSWREAVFLPLAFISLSFAPKLRGRPFPLTSAVRHVPNLCVRGVRLVSAGSVQISGLSLGLLQRGRLRFPFAIVLQFVEKSSSRLCNG